MVDINSLTVGQIKEIAGMLNLGVSANSREQTPFDLFIGKPVLVRHHLNGVNCGILTSPSKEGFYLKGGRKFWRWQADKGVSLESFARSQREEGTRASHIYDSVYIPAVNLCGVILLSNSEFSDMLNIKVAEQD